MAPTFISEWSVSLNDSMAFARLSGDYNPLHVDPIAARRTRFGNTVAHGVHLFLRALNDLAAQGAFGGYVPVALSASFGNAITTGSIVRMRADAVGRKIRIFAECAGRAAFNGTVELESPVGLASAAEDAEFTTGCPEDVPFPPAVTTGAVPLKLSNSLLVALFPSLAHLVDTGWIADLLATTQIVGMRCPGMHSIYSNFRLRYTDSQLASTSMHYCVDGVQPRFQLLRIQVVGPRLSGMVETFFRPRPTPQRSMEDVAAAVSPSTFTGQRVLIVGGSRGLGELTAKIVASGGADVTITYAQGKEDAERVSAEVRAAGRACTIHHLHLPSAGATARGWLASSHFTHVYFFASPLISQSPKGWDEALFRQFADMYVTAFAILVEHILSARTDRDRPVHFLYPSSVFLDRPEAGFVEYAVAKAAGEALCDQLQGHHGARFWKPRLPRMRTDQTGAIVDIGAVDPLPIILDVVQHLHS